MVFIIYVTMVHAQVVVYNLLGANKAMHCWPMQLHGLALLDGTLHVMNI